MSDVDVIIVGGGPAGAALACLLGKSGVAVRLFDRATFPRDKVCGECLSPGALASLHALGVGDRLLTAGATPYGGLRLVAPDGTSAEARYPGGALGYSISRLQLDAVLLERARATPGVEVHEGQAVSALLRQSGPDSPITGVRLATGAEVTARVVVGADGRFSMVRRLAFGSETLPRTDRYCFVNTFAGGAGHDDLLECGLVAPGLQYLQVCQGQGRFSVCLVVDGATRDAQDIGRLAGYTRAVERLPRLARRLAGSRPVGPLKGMPMTPYRPRELVAAGLLLTGDAVGFMDSITGEGLCRAFQAAELAAQTLLSALNTPGDSLPRAALRPYELALRARYAPVLAFVELTVGLTTLPVWASNGLVKLMGAHPRAAEAFVATQGALLSPERLLQPLCWPAWRTDPLVAAYRPLVPAD